MFIFSAHKVQRVSIFLCTQSPNNVYFFLHIKSEECIIDLALNIKKHCSMPNVIQILDLLIGYTFD